MRTLVTALALALSMAPLADANAQDPASSGGLPDAVVTEALELYNATETLRASGSLTIAAEQRVDGNVAVLLGPLTIAGEVAGRVVVINGDLLLRPGARIGGGVLVIGGAISGRDDAVITGEVRVHRQPLPYREVEGRLEAEPDAWWRPWERSPLSRSRLRILSAGAYNRVEGLPIKIGPALEQETPWGRVKLEALGIIRTADEFHWDSENLGHSASVELGFGGDRGLAIGARHYDIVNPVEDWHLRDVEAALAAALFHRDYRDHYNRHGGGAWLTYSPGRDVDLTVAYSNENWATRRSRDPFSLFRNGDDWRDNPIVDDGSFHIGHATLAIDTRNNEDDPWSGWYITADYELGSGTVTSFGPASLLAREPMAEPGDVTYHRGFLDLRRYNRISPDAQLNLRVVLGGWLAGDELPLQRRLSVGGSGTLPGFDFRRFYESEDVGMCTTAGDALQGRPAMCERVALFQAEYRGDLLFGRDWEAADRWLGGMRRSDMAWVLFFDAGRGWLVGDRVGEIQYEGGSLPSFGTFRTDVGLGIDLGLVGVYVAKSISQSKEPANVFVRIRHRF